MPRILLEPPSRNEAKDIKVHPVDRGSLNSDFEFRSSDLMARSVSEGNPVFLNNRSSLRIFEKV